LATKYYNIIIELEWSIPLEFSFGGSVKGLYSSRTVRALSYEQAVQFAKLAVMNEFKPQLCQSDSWQEPEIRVDQATQISWFQYYFRGGPNKGCTFYPPEDPVI